MTRYAVSFSFMFSNRFIGVKIAAGLAAFLFLCGHSQSTFEPLFPTFWECQTAPEHFHGQELFIAVTPVSQRLDNRFEIVYQQNRIWVNHPPSSLNAGDYVTMTGRFYKNNTIEPHEIRVHKGYPWKRSMMLLVSAMMLGILAIQWFRAFRPPEPDGLFKRRT